LRQINRFTAIHLIAYDSCSLGRQMDTYLVHTPGNRFALDKCVVPKILYRIKNSFGGFSISTIYRDIFVSLVQNRQIYRQVCKCMYTADNGMVYFIYAPAFKLDRNQTICFGLLSQLK